MTWEVLLPPSAIFSSVSLPHCVFWLYQSSPRPSSHDISVAAVSLFLMVRHGTRRSSHVFWCTWTTPFISLFPLVILHVLFIPVRVHAALKRSIAREEPEGQIPSRRRRGMCLSGGSNTYTVFKCCRFRRLRVCCSCMRHALPMRTFASRCVCCPPP